MNLEERVSNIRFQHEKEESISEDLVKEIIRKLFFEHILSVRSDVLIRKIIKHTKRDYPHARAIMEKMSILGINFCMDMGDYSLVEFAEMRDYITEKELGKVYDEIDCEEKKLEELERHFEEKYGEDSSKWSDQVWDEYYAAGGV